MAGLNFYSETTVQCCHLFSPQVYVSQKKQPETQKSPSIEVSSFDRISISERGFLLECINEGRPTSLQCCSSALTVPFQLVSGQSGLWAESVWGWAGLGHPGPGEETFPEEAASRPGWGTEPPRPSLSARTPPTRTSQNPHPASPLLSHSQRRLSQRDPRFMLPPPWNRLPALLLDWSSFVNCLPANWPHPPHPLPSHTQIQIWLPEKRTSYKRSFK